MSEKKALPPTDLSNAFARPSRASGLRLPTARPVQKAAEAPQTAAAVAEAPKAAPEPEAPQTAPEAPAMAPAAAAKPAKAKKAAKKAPARKPVTGASPLVLWTPRSIRSRMQAVQRERGTSYLDQVLDALETNADRLSELISGAVEKPHVQGRLFERAAPSTSKAPETGDLRVQLTIRGVLDSQLAVIDELATSTGAGSRSALCNAALDAWLPGA